MGRPCARHPRFLTVLTRAPVAPQAEELDAKAVRNGILHCKLAKYGPKWSAWLVRDVGFPHAKLMISCFHRKLHKQLLVSDHWHQKVASLAPECKTYYGLYYFLHAQGGRMDGFGGPWGCRGAKCPPGKVRFCKENECLLCFSNPLGSQVGVI